MHPLQRLSRLPLYWQVLLINGAVFALGAVALLLSPATVSRQVLVSEAVVLVGGLALVLVVNALLLRRSLAPVDRVVREMQVVELHDGQRLTTPATGPGARLVGSYNAMLDRLEAERSASNARALAAQEAERHRIAQELHDQVGQDLTVVLLGLKQLAARAPAELVEELELLRDSARTGLDDVRRVARELRPGVLADLGLGSALAALCSDFTAHGGLPVRRTIAPGLPDLGPERELVVYRVAQEALTNAARHARGATEVTLSLARVGGNALLEVTDDGRGATAVVPGSGVRGMRERAVLVGATVSVDGGPAGTTVRLVVPLPEVAP
ncbi:sensor histidine kinase [Nocardioides euryhalodurans]|uniref:histidine kinase n=1 Tax=Nocardioides euryhalodurans TaxID=2518370 RepID=A0A4P7GJ48_9ACTN|nr:sensor histidine kinase [Nocardioides euryhalodurans]QBR91903.1 sensor histidine kinase [Nocardioides euryhalodurans]